MHRNLVKGAGAAERVRGATLQPDSATLADEVAQKSPCVSLLGRQENAAMLFGKMRGGLDSSKPRRPEQLLKRDLLHLEPHVWPKPIQDLREISQCFIAHVGKMAAFAAVFNPESRRLRLRSKH
jgi:hypothetical protein